MKRLFTALLFSLAFSYCFAQNRVLQSHSSTFIIKNAGIEVKGSFSSISTVIRFDPAQPETGSIEATVDVKSIDTGISLRNKHLKGEEYFDADKYPYIKMKSGKLEKTATGFKGLFKLSIKDKTKELSIPFTFAAGLFSSSFTINRRNFDVGGYNMLMSDDVLVNIELKTLPAK